MASTIDPSSSSQSSNRRDKFTSNRWLAALLVVVVCVVGFGVYYVVFRDNRAPVGEILVETGDYSDADLIVCLDNQQTVTISQNEPYDFNTVDSSDDIQLTLANYFLDEKGGDFTILEGQNAGQHHIDRGQC